MPERPLNENELMDAYRGVRSSDQVAEEAVPSHFHLDRRTRTLVWHNHVNYTVNHRLDVDTAHPKRDPRRATLRTHDNKKLEDT